MYITMHMMIKDISSLPTVITQWAEEIQSREIHQRFKHAAPGDYDDGDDGEEGRGHKIEGDTSKIQTCC